MNKLRCVSDCKACGQHKTRGYWPVVDQERSNWSTEKPEQGAEKRRVLFLGAFTIVCVPDEKTCSFAATFYYDLTIKYYMFIVFSEWSVTHDAKDSIGQN